MIHALRTEIQSALAILPKTNVTARAHLTRAAELAKSLDKIAHGAKVDEAARGGDEITASDIDDMMSVAFVVVGSDS